MTRLNPGKRARSFLQPTLVLWSSCFVRTFSFQTHLRKKKVPILQGTKNETKTGRMTKPREAIFDLYCRLCVVVFNQTHKTGMGENQNKRGRMAPALYGQKKVLGNRKIMMHEPLDTLLASFSKDYFCDLALQKSAYSSCVEETYTSRPKSH